MVMTMLYNLYIAIKNILYFILNPIFFINHYLIKVLTLVIIKLTF